MIIESKPPSSMICLVSESTTNCKSLLVTSGECLKSWSEKFTKSSHGYENSPATPGSKSALSAEAAAQETRGKRNTPAMFESSRLQTSGNEKRLTTLMVSPTI